VDKTFIKCLGCDGFTILNQAGRRICQQCDTVHVVDDQGALREYNLKRSMYKPPTEPVQSCLRRKHGKTFLGDRKLVDPKPVKNVDGSLFQRCYVNASGDTVIDCMVCGRPSDFVNSEQCKVRTNPIHLKRIKVWYTFNRSMDQVVEQVERKDTVVPKWIKGRLCSSCQRDTTLEILYPNTPGEKPRGVKDIPSLERKQAPRSYVNETFYNQYGRKKWLI